MAGRHGRGATPWEHSSPSTFSPTNTGYSSWSPDSSNYIFSPVSPPLKPSAEPAYQTSGELPIGLYGYERKESKESMVSLPSSIDEVPNTLRPADGRADSVSRDAQSPASQTSRRVSGSQQNKRLINLFQQPSVRTTKPRPESMLSFIVSEEEILNR